MEEEVPLHSYTHHAPTWKNKEELQYEDDLVADFYNEHPQSESSDNESDAKRKKRRRNRDPYDYLPGSPVPQGPSDIEITRALHWDNMLRKESEQHLRSGAQKQQKTTSF